MMCRLILSWAVTNHASISSLFGVDPKFYPLMAYKNIFENTLLSTQSNMAFAKPF